MSRRRKELKFALFEVWMTDEQVRESYQRSFGEQPKELRRTGGGVLAGPVDPKVLRQRESR